MKRLRPFTIGAASVAMIIGVTTAALAHGNERGQAKANIGKAQVTIDYGRPTLKGRDMLKKIGPGQMWRLGCDAPTTIESTVDLDFGGTRVPKGKHILLARLVEPGKWTLVVSSKSIFDYDPSTKIAEVPMDFSEAGDPAQELTIQLSSDAGRGVIEIAWGTSRLTALFTPAK